MNDGAVVFEFTAMTGAVPSFVFIIPADGTALVRAFGRESSNLAVFIFVNGNFLIILTDHLSAVRS